MLNCVPWIFPIIPISNIVSYFLFQISRLLRTVAELKQINQQQAIIINQQARTISELQQRTTRKKPQLDIQLKRQIRHVTKTLAEEKGIQFDLHVSISDTHNQQVLRQIAEGAQGSDHKFPEDQAMEAAQRHFINLRDEMMRRLNGTKDRHCVTMRKHARKEKKLKFRRGGLAHEKCPLSAEEKVKAKRIMAMDFMSSDEDPVFTDPDGQKYRQVRVRTWESQEASYYKSVSFDTYVKYVVDKRDRKKVHLLRRDENSKPSDVPCPNGTPAWAVNT